MARVKTHCLWLGLFTLGLWASLDGQLFPASQNIAMAKSSGGRSRGGSFQRSSPPSRPSTPTQPRRSTTTPSLPRSRDFDRQPSAIPIPIPVPVPNRYPSYPNNNSSDFDRRNGEPVIPSNDGISGAILDDAVINNGQQSAQEFTERAITAPPQQTSPAQSQTAPSNQTVRDNGGSGGSAAWLLLPGAAIVGGTGVMLYAANKKKQAGGSSNIQAAAPGSAAEINNDIMTISQVQLALLASSPIQQQLSEIVKTMAIETPEQLKAQLQAVVVTLLRLPEYWSHAKVMSETLANVTQAESTFEQWSMRERSKLSEETLTKDSFGLREKAVIVDPEEDPAAYVVVTLLIGSTNDRPLFESVTSAADVQAVLERLAALTTPELLTFELIWSPQDAADSLTRDELTTEYSDLMMV